MQITDFTNFLDDHGIYYKSAQNSIVLRTCPHCNSSKDKVWLFKDRKEDSGPFFGRCMKCEAKINSYSYLIDMGIDRSAVSTLHGRMQSDGLRLQVAPLDWFNAKAPEAKADFENGPIIPVDISAFVAVDTIPDHPASLYAIKRGWTPAQRSDILIDYFSSAVVFVARYEGQVVGFQRRYLNPIDPSRKTMSSLGFQKRRFVIEYPNDGDICVCEGPFSALSACHFGYHAICTFGSNVGEQQLQRIASLAEQTGKGVAVAFDIDSAGRKGYRNIRYVMKSKEIFSYRIKPELGNDLNDSFMAGKGAVVIPVEYEDISIPMLSLPFKEFA